MKFKNAETGETFHTIEDALESYCKHMVSCDTCPLYQTNTGTSLTCNEFVNRHPGEFARLILYSPIPQDYLNTDQCPCDQCYMGPRKLPICHTCLVYQAWERRKEQRKSEAAEKYLKIKGADTEDRRDKPCDSCQRGKGTGLSYYFECGNCGENGVFDRFKPNEEDNMNKPLKDWTLGELKEYCGTAVYQCHKGVCPFKNICDRITSENLGERVVPGDWDLTNKPHFTEQEVEDAKTLLRVFPEQLDSISRSKDGTVTLAAKGAWRGYLNNDAFPSIQPGQSYTLDEIIGGGE